MIEDEALRHAEALAHTMGISFYVVRNREGDFLPVQEPPEDCEIVATVVPPAFTELRTSTESKLGRIAARGCALRD
jgi:hypothetical protein